MGIRQLGLRSVELSSPSNPPAGQRLLYPKPDGSWASRDSSGAEARIVTDRTSVVMPTAVGSMITPFNYVSSANSVQTSGDIGMVPVILEGGSWDALVAQVTTAQSGGTVALTLGVYGSDPDTGLPVLAGGPIRSAASPALTSTGNRITTFTAWTPTPGLYWLAALYVQTAAPTTVPQFAKIANHIRLPGLTTTVLSQTVRGYSMTGQTSLPSSGTISEETGTRCLLLGIRRSA
ncbi:hypothetical protein [Phycicoccus avicenniae]|uniref:hypothetical protein n=1 Tax=Phycicoccus avicenniae TaxID=2828860 RepID=UPI003D2B6790